ncbi:hypothetical protein HPB51_016505 [Rhipicephalus microplus]|uniref:Uncharacterized protein n=1 Tax=Rhipicephalus microplus TaxID=6941 RepID=A0A9J6E2Y6_RHIMP|nr:hypothetical protein HPB51_016505 [Rhipicephalus microplus]
MPLDAIHMVGWPKTPVDLTKLLPWQLYEALLKVASLPDQPLAFRDEGRVHSTNNTFPLSVPESVRAQAYLRITSLKIGVRTIEFHLYAPPPNDAFHGIMFNVYDSFPDAEILKDLQESNSTMPVIGGHRVGRTNHVLVPMLGDCLPRWIFYHGVYIRLYFFYPLTAARWIIELTFRNSCARCGEEQLSIPQGTQPTCRARCIVFKGGHATDCSNCKYRFVKKPTPSGHALAQAPHEEPQPQQPSILRTNPSPSQEQSYPRLSASRSSSNKPTTPAVTVEVPVQVPIAVPFC